MIRERQDLDQSITQEGRRYVGCAASKPRRESDVPGPAVQQAAPVIQLRGTRQRSGSTSDVASRGAMPVTTRKLALRWSVRLLVVLVVVSVLAGGLRVTGLLLPPVDAPVGTEATYAAAANVLAEKVVFANREVRAIPLSAPWQGAATVDPGAGLPVYTWLSGYGMKYLGLGEWIGRVLSVLFSLLAGLLLFALVRRTSGARAGLYALLVYTLSPLSILIGSQLAPYTLIVLSQIFAVLTLVWWRQSLDTGLRGGSQKIFGLAVVAGVVCALISAGGLVVIAPAVYLIISEEKGPWGLREAWARSPHRGKLVAYVALLASGAVLWGLFRNAAQGGLILEAADGGYGAAIIGNLFNSSSYMAIIGAIVGKALTMVGLLLVGAGLIKGARMPQQWLFHYWFVGGFLVALLESGRLGRHEDVLIPLLAPAFALAGIGAAWAGSLPSRVWLALAETRRERDSDYSVSPHTAWLLDLPEEKFGEPDARPQAKPALSKSLAQRSRVAGARVRRAGLMLAGHIAVLGAVGIIGMSGWGAAASRAISDEASVIVGNIGSDLSQLTAPTARVIIAGPHAAGVFYSARRTGWAVPESGFSLPEVQRLQREGASYLLSADQEWLGRQADYMGILTNYAVSKLTRDYILFDLNTKPADSDRIYFLESGHTLSGAFRAFWEAQGGLAKLGYPLSEELREVNPVDGVERTVQFFERAVLEYHPEMTGNGHAVMLASVGLWVTRGRTFQPVVAFENRPDRVYFSETGHSLKESFLRYWLANGDVRQFGYPVSEELPEISAQDGKVYTVQYFERARLEWHPTDAGSGKEVQLGLIGKQAYEMRP